MYLFLLFNLITNILTSSALLRVLRSSHKSGCPGMWVVVGDQCLQHVLFGITNKLEMSSQDGPHFWGWCLNTRVTKTQSFHHLAYNSFLSNAFERKFSPKWMLTHWVSIPYCSGDTYLLAPCVLTFLHFFLHSKNLNWFVGVRGWELSPYVYWDTDFLEKWFILINNMW